MKSRSYYARAIEDSQQRRVAVVVFESIEPSGALDFIRIKEKLCGEEGKRIAQFLDRMRALEPTPSYAQQEGY